MKVEERLFAALCGLPNAVPENCFREAFGRDPALGELDSTVKLVKSKIEEYRFAGQGDRGIADIEISKREKRLRRLDWTWKLLQSVIEERGAEHANEPGGMATGLMLRIPKSVGAGPKSIQFDELVLDTAVLRELRELEEQASRECGQWGSAVEFGKEQRQVMIILPDNGRG